MHSFKTGISVLFSCFLLHSSCLIGQEYASPGNFQLAAPQIRCDSIFFTNHATVQLELALEDVDIYFTLDGSMPNAHAVRYEKPLVIRQPGTLSAIALHPEFQNSEVVTLPFFKVSSQARQVEFNMDRQPNDRYPGSGPAGLGDLKKGTQNFQSEAWMGFQGGTIDIACDFQKQVNASKVTVSLLSAPDAWIFPPARAELYEVVPGGALRLIDAWNNGEPGKEMQTGFRYVTFALNEPARKLMVRVTAVQEIPEWHPGKGTPAWLFIDEIFFHD